MPPCPGSERSELTSVPAVAEFITRQRAGGGQSTARQMRDSQRLSATKDAKGTEGAGRRMLQGASGETLERRPRGAAGLRGAAVEGRLLRAKGQKSERPAAGARPGGPATDRCGATRGDAAGESVRSVVEPGTAGPSEFILGERGGRRGPQQRWEGVPERVRSAARTNPPTARSRRCRGCAGCVHLCTRVCSAKASTTSAQLGPVLHGGATLFFDQ